MRSKRVIRYYCDHCSRGSLTKPSMADHEHRCFRNPHRVCPLCDRGDCVADDIASLNAGGLTVLREETNGCPACIMSAILQSVDPKEDWIAFDYKKEREAWNDERHAEWMENHGHF